MNTQSDHSDVDHITDLMRQLDSLIEGEAASAKLVACGPPAIEPLRRFVLEGQPSGVPQPRCWAVKALAALGAHDVLIDYLEREPARDPVVRLGEESVQREAALALASWGTEQAFQFLMGIADRQSIPGIIEALGHFNRRAVVPVLLHALEDDFCRPWAEVALERRLDPDRDLMIRSALTSDPDALHEARPSLRRRRALMQLLRTRGMSMHEAHWLAPLIESRDLELAVDAAAIALASGTAEDRRRAWWQLEAVAATAPWDLHSDIQRLLDAASRYRPAR